MQIPRRGRADPDPRDRRCSSAARVAGRAHTPETPQRGRAGRRGAAPRGRRAISHRVVLPGPSADVPQHATRRSRSRTSVTTDADAVVTVHPDNGGTPIVRTLTVPANTVRTFDRATLVERRPAPATDTGRPSRCRPARSWWSRSRPTSSCGRASSRTPRSTSCRARRRPSTDWYFAAGTTVRGVSQWLVLDDPFSADARVDITLRTEHRLAAAARAAGPRRARPLARRHPDPRHAVRQDRVAVEVHAVVGQVVARRRSSSATDVRARPASRRRSARSRPSSRWWFTDGNARRRTRSQWVAVTDLGADRRARRRAGAASATKAIVQPVVLTVPRAASSWVQIGGCARSEQGLPRRARRARGFELTVQSDSERADRRADAQPLQRRKTAVGATTSMGSTAPAARTG